jgi:hypothetical protein
MTLLTGSVSCGPTYQQLPPSLFWAVAPPAPATLGLAPASFRQQSSDGALPNHCHVERPSYRTPHCSRYRSSLERPKLRRHPPFLPLPLHHFSLGSSTRKAALSLVTHCPSYLIGVKAKAAAFSPLPSELRPLVHHVIDQAAPHPPLSATLPQELSEPIAAEPLLPAVSSWPHQSRWAPVATLLPGE